MIKILRRIIFFLFLAVFLVGAPKIIFYALGYSYRVGSEKGLVQTGLIYLSTTPPGATVYVDGRRYRDPTPAIIRDLLPGNYPIRLVLKDHEIWTKTVPVEAAKASVLGKILLYPKKWAWQRRVSEPIQNLIPIPDTKYILLQSARRGGALQVYDRKAEATRPLFSDAENKALQLLDIYLASGNEKILLMADFQGKKKWAWLDLDKEGRGPLEWQENFPARAQGVFYSVKDPHYFFDKNYEHFLQDQKHLRVTLEQKNILGFRFDKKNRKAVVWRKSAIGVIHFSKEEKEWGVSRASLKSDWILNQAQNISRAFWAHDGAYIIFQDQNKVFLLELETFGAPSLYELLETKEKSQIFYTDESGELFYLDKNTSHLMSLEVVPKWKVLEVPFAILKEKEKEGKVAA